MSHFWEILLNKFIKLANKSIIGLCAKHFESRKFEFYSIKIGFSNAVTYRVLMHDCFDALHIKCSLQKMHYKCWRRYQIPTGWFLMDCCCIKIIYLMHQCNMSRTSSTSHTLIVSKNFLFRNAFSTSKKFDSELHFWLFILMISFESFIDYFSRNDKYLEYNSQTFIWNNLFIER